MNNKNPTTFKASQTFLSFEMIALTSLFFIWGFITSVNDVLIPHLKGVFELNFTQAALIQFCFFGAYFLISIPAGKLVKAIGFKYGIAIGLFIACVGCLLFIPAAKLQLYWMFLMALFVLASGITTLQVAANPLVTLFGDARNASQRLTLTQAFNSLGATLAPIVAGYVLFSLASVASQGQNAESVILPYLLLAALLLVLAITFARMQLPTPSQDDDSNQSSSGSVQSIYAQRHLILGVLAIFLYVGAEVSIGSFLINFLGEDNVAGMDEAIAANFIAYYWGGALVGRFIGAMLMEKIAPNKLLAFNGVMSVLLLVVAVISAGKIAMWSLLLVGLFNSIMFPTIFSLAIKSLGSNTGKGSGLLCLGIVGGAIIPLVQGMFADSLGLQLSFLLPLICYLYIAFYGLVGFKPVLIKRFSSTYQAIEK